MIRPITMAFVVVIVAASLTAEDRVLRVQVRTIAGAPMIRQLIGLAGNSTFETTDAQGNAMLRLPAQTRPGDRVTLRLYDKNLLFVSPDGGQTHVPSFEEKPDNYVAVLIAKKGDAELLKSGEVLRTFIEKVLSGVRKIQSENAKATPEMLRKVLDERAAELGHSPADLDQVIRTLPEMPVSLADKDLAARYVEQFPQSIQQISGGSVIVTGGTVEGSIITNPQGSPITIQQRQHDVDSALSVIARAVESRPTGNIGQIAAVEHLVHARSSLEGMDLAGLTLAGASLDAAQFSEAVLNGASFSKTSLKSAALREAQIEFANLEEARLDATDLRGARLYFTVADKAVCERAKAVQSNWLGASARSVNFRGADLRAANFAYADLSDADFEGADLTEAVFAHAILKGTSFKSAVIRNTDFTGAVADPSIFSPTQQSEVCGSGPDQHVGRVELVRIVTSTRFDSGLSYQDLMHIDIPVAYEDWMLEPCKARSHVAAGFPSVWRDTVLTFYRIGYPAALLDKGDRADKFERRLRDQAARLEAATKDRRLVILGSTHAAILRAIESNVKKTAPLSAPTLDADDTLALLIARDRQDLVDDYGWLDWARWRMDEERSLAGKESEQANPWPRLFPAEYSPRQLSPAHAQLFREWTLARAKHVPTEFVITTDVVVPSMDGRDRNKRSYLLTPLAADDGERKLPDGALQRVGAVDGYEFSRIHAIDRDVIFAFKQPLNRLGIEITKEEAAALSGETTAEVRVRVVRTEMLPSLSFRPSTTGE